jgi:protein-tyrosine-phosphatase
MQRRLKVLFVCTANSARSQIAEALVRARSDARIEAGSAGTQPAPRVNPLAVAVLREYGIDATTARPKTIDEVVGAGWDIVITVCDSARESCPIFPGQPALAHWGVADPAAVEGDDATKLKAFREAALVLSRRIDLMLALPMEKLESLALESELRRIGAGQGRERTTPVRAGGVP